MTGDGAWFETLESREVYRSDRSVVRIDRVRMPDGAEALREVIEHGDAVAIVPLRADGNVVLLKQYRHAVGGYVLEIPAGKLDVDGEQPEDAANRELAEEVGLHADSVVALTTFRNSAGWCTERTHVYLGTNLREVPLPEGFVREAEEADMEVILLPLDAAVEEVQSGRIEDAKTVVGLLMASAHVSS